METQRILLTSAFTSIGATLLAHILASNEPALIYQTLDVLVCSAAEAQRVWAAYHDRVNPITYSKSDSSSSGEGSVFLEDVAKEFDIILDASSEEEEEQAKQLIDGLARRAATRASSGAPWFVRVAGGAAAVPARDWIHPTLSSDEEEGGEWFSGHLAVQPVEAEHASSPESETTELEISKYASSRGVQAVILQTCCVFGHGDSEGVSNPQQQGWSSESELARTLRWIVRHGGTSKVNEDDFLDWIHILDLSDYIIHLLSCALDTPRGRLAYLLPSDERVIHLAAGRTPVTEIAERAVDMGFAEGILPRTGRRESRAMQVRDLAEMLGFGGGDDVKMPVGIAKQGKWGPEKGTGMGMLGWKPTRGEDQWNRSLDKALVEMMGGRRGVIYQ